MLFERDFLVWLTEVDKDDRHTVGQEFSELGALSRHSVLIPQTFLVTNYAFKRFQEENNLQIQIKHLLGTLNYSRHDSLVQVSGFLQKIICTAPVPRDIFEKLFKFYDTLHHEHVSLEAYYFRDGKLVSKKMWVDIQGEAVLAEKLRIAWAHLFAVENLTTHNIHPTNHHTFTVTVAVRPKMEYDLTGYVTTHTHKKDGGFEIHAHAEKKDLLNEQDTTTIIEYAKISRKLFYLPQILHWGRSHKKIFVTTILPSSEVIHYKDTYTDFLQAQSLHPGVTVGRLRIIGSNKENIDLGHDEIVYLDSVDKSMVAALKKAKGIILGDIVDPEVSFILKSFGIPTIIKAKHIKSSYTEGEVVSLNATTGEIKKGSILI